MTDICGLFPVSYHSVGTPPGAPILHLNLLVSTPDQRVTGTATITRAVLGPSFKVHVAGVYSVMTVMGPVTHIQVKLGGVVFEDGKNLADNLKKVAASSDTNKLFDALLVLEGDWSAGTATYSWLAHPTPIEQEIVEGAG